MTRLERYENATSGLLTAFALAFLVVYGAPIIWPELPAAVRAACETANVAIWVLFALDLLVRFTLAERRWAYLAHHPIDVLSVLLPMLRPLRVLRVFAAGHALLTRGRGLLRTGQAIVLSAGVLVVIGALAILDAERGVDGATITTFPDALWWAMTTVTTVGYGDLFPVSGLGRGVATSLMVVGISLLGVVTATVAAWFVNEAEDERAEDERAEDERAEDERAGGERAEARGLSVAARLRELELLREEGLVSAEEHSTVRKRVLDSL